MMEQPSIEYTKKARHGHAQDVVDDNNIRQVAGCLPIDPINKKFLLITSSNKNNDNWVLPKGGWEEDETQAQAALRETWEEAGIKGRITRQLGVFEEATKKQIKAHHWIFELEIDEVCKKFPEKKKRERRWYTFEEALLVVKGQYMKDAITLSSLNPSNSVPHVTTLISQPTFHLQQTAPATAPATSLPAPTSASIPTTTNDHSKHSSFTQGIKALFKR
ncbi:NUDIX hydrolase domain-like protein [Halteromyces radiatus]|uniref:NUDIX hydrolase domain-like protein n=1 Tax=Halteromyces radiatus TaxID=101107 RepID=UPI0022204003|nr:NUDIX hydrolase domain-like protein [Halteromyces radiatus]KAI8098617.1 NUDIX hydrolase domain-like protein [Halteromyces radiatus]